MNSEVKATAPVLASPVLRHHACRGHEARRLPTTRCVRDLAVCALGLMAILAAENRASAQEPVVLPAAPVAYPVPYPPVRRSFHFCDFFLPDDGIPRTYSYYYTPWLNQPRHVKFVGPDGRKYWQSTVRGVPMGMQWAAP
jgi:hypothetical protein